MELRFLGKNVIPQDINDFDYDDTRTSLLGNEEITPANVLFNFTDDNLVLHDGEEIKNKNDKDLRDSMLLLTYLILAVCYMKEAHFKEALQSIEDAKKLNERNSLVYFRRAQCRACNLCSSLKELKEAKQDIEKAIYLSQLEEKSEQKVYIELAHFIENRIKALRDKIQKNVEGMLNFIYNSFVFIDICERLKTELSFSENEEEYLKEHELAIEIMKKYEDNYGELLEKKYFKEAENIKKEMIILKQKITEMEFFLYLNFQDLDKNENAFQIIQAKK